MWREIYAEPSARRQNGGFRGEEDAAASTRMEKILKRVMIGAALLLGAELFWLLGISPFMPLARIDVNGSGGLERVAGMRELILAGAGIGPQTSFVSLDTKAAEKALESLYFVDTARVSKYYPDRAVINLEGRRALALSLGALEGRMVPVIFDREGVVIQVGKPQGTAKDLEAIRTLPIISGILFNDPALGMRIPALFTGLLEDIDVIRREAPELLEALSEIQVLRRSFDGFEIMLYPVNYKVKVRLGPELNEDLLRYTLLMVDVVSARNPGIGTLDFRTGTASYSLKEVSSEQ